MQVVLRLLCGVGRQLLWVLWEVSAAVRSVLTAALIPDLVRLAAVTAAAVSDHCHFGTGSRCCGVEELKGSEGGRGVRCLGSVGSGVPVSRGKKKHFSGANRSTK